LKYSQPYGVSDPNASYTNGNPSTGTMGSIPPAAAIENPQREIVNTISSTGIITPGDGDLSQLAKAIQSGQLNFEHDTGTANNYATNMSPNPGSYFEGLMVILKMLNTNTGPSVLNLNSLGNKPIVRSDGSPLVGDDIVAGFYICFLYDGTSFRMVWSQGGGGIAGQPVWLTTSKDFYVNGATGNDTYDGTSATFVSGIKGPFKTLQRAAYEYPKYNLNGFAITIHVADGTYIERVSCPGANGSGAISWIGNPASPASCQIYGPPSGGSAMIVAGDTLQMFNGFLFGAVASLPADLGYGIWITPGANVQLMAIAWSSTIGAHLAVTESFVQLHGPFTLMGGSAAFMAGDGGRIAINSVAPPSLTAPVACNFTTAFAHLSNLARSAGPWGTVAGPLNIIGPKFYVYGNSVLNTWGLGPTGIPGTTAGTATLGGIVF